MDGVSPWRPLSVRRTLGVLVVATLGVVVAGLGIGPWIASDLRARLADRARDEVLVELSRLAVADLAGVWPERRDEVCEPGVISSGIADGPSSAPAKWRADIERLSADREARTVGVAGGSGVVLGVRWIDDGHLAWAAVEPRVPAALATYRDVALALLALELALVVLALWLLAAVRADAGELARAVERLKAEPTAEPPPARTREYAEVLARMAELARTLARERSEVERLGREMASAARLASLGRVACGVAHEVRNPLASMKLRVDLARTGPPDWDQHLRDLDDIAQEIGRLDRLASDLLVLGRQSRVRAEPRALRPLVEARAGWVARSAAERGVRLEVDGTGTAYADADAFAQALDNVLRNAIQASPRGGVVRIEILEDGDDACVVVADDGPGVPEDQVHHLFEPFHTTRPDGTGLGLAITHAIVTAHGGAVRYDRVGGRTRFVLRLRRVLVS